MEIGLKLVRYTSSPPFGIRQIVLVLSDRYRALVVKISVIRPKRSPIMSSKKV